MEDTIAKLEYGLYYIKASLQPSTHSSCSTPAKVMLLSRGSQ